MLFITIQVDATPDQAQGIKEDLATHLERFGDTKVISVREQLPEQMQIYGTGGAH